MIDWDVYRFAASATNFIPAAMYPTSFGQGI